MDQINNTKPIKVKSQSIWPYIRLQLKLAFKPDKKRNKALNILSWVAKALVFILALFFAHRFVDRLVHQSTFVHGQSVSIALFTLFELILLIYSISIQTKRLYRPNDLRLISVMPYTSFQKYVAEIIAIFLRLSIYTGVIFYPLILVYGWGAGIIDVKFVFSALLAVAVLPLLPFALSLVISVPFMFLGDWLKNKNLLKLILFIVLFVILLVLYAFILKFISDFYIHSKNTKEVLQGIANFLDKMNRPYNFCYFTSEICLGNKIYINLPILLVICAGLGAIGIGITKPLYDKIMVQGLSEGDATVTNLHSFSRVEYRKHRLDLRLGDHSPIFNQIKFDDYAAKIEAKKTYFTNKMNVKRSDIEYRKNLVLAKELRYKGDDISGFKQQIQDKVNKLDSQYTQYCEYVKSKHIELDRDLSDKKRVLELQAQRRKQNFDSHRYESYKRSILAKKAKINARVEAKASKPANPYVTIFAKELKQILRTPTYAYFYLGVAFSMPIMTFLTTDIIRDIGAAQVGSKQFFGFGLLVICIIMSLVGSYSANVISREGKQFYITKVSPLSYRKQLFAKGLVNFAVALIGLILCILVLGCTCMTGSDQMAGLTGQGLGFLFAISFVFLIGITLNGINLDIARPKIDMLSGKANDSNIVIQLIIGLIITGLISMLAITVGAINDAATLYVQLGILGLMILYAVINFLIFFFVSEKKYRNIEIK